MLEIEEHKPNVAVVGAGPAGLMAAETLAAAGVAVTIYERMPSPGRKFLLAGRGGLNLTHSEPVESFRTRYREAQPFLAAPLDAFTPQQLRTWCEGLGQEMFVGSSGRVFPRAMKASPLLRAWLRRLAGQGVVLRTRSRWTGWDAAGAPLIADAAGVHALAADALVLALGGGSWPQLGSDGSWIEHFTAAGLATRPLKPANCGFRTAWTAHFIARAAGHPLKRIALTAEGTRVRGEAVITDAGLEGGAVYALAPLLRDAIDRDGSALLHIDLRPDLTREDLARRLARPRGKHSLTNYLRKTLHLGATDIALLQECAHRDGVTLAALQPEGLGARIKSVDIRLTEAFPLARAISSAGGVPLAALDEHSMLRARPGVFVAGEMLDWEAPTGGYLLQACFATGRAAGQGVLHWLAARGRLTRAAVPPDPPAGR